MIHIMNHDLFLRKPYITTVFDATSLASLMNLPSDIQNIGIRIQCLVFMLRFTGSLSAIDYKSLGYCTLSNLRSNALIEATWDGSTIPRDILFALSDIDQSTKYEINFYIPNSFERRVCSTIGAKEWFTSLLYSDVSSVTVGEFTYTDLAFLTTKNYDITLFGDYNTLQKYDSHYRIRVPHNTLFIKNCITRGDFFRRFMFLLRDYYRVYASEGGDFIV